jgi:branched-chain amino acid transport system permease protein
LKDVGLNDFLELMVSVGEAGGIYSLVALAYLVTLRPTGVINFAIGEWAGVGAFVGIAAVVDLKLPFVLALPLVLCATGLIGWLAERLAVRPLLERDAPVLSPILALLGVLVMTHEAIIFCFGTSNQFAPSPLGAGPVVIGPLVGATQSFLIIAVTGVVFLGAWWFFERTVAGRAFEAVAIDRFAAGLVGINLRLTAALAFAAGGAIAGLAGLLQSPLTSASYLMGLPLSIKGFSALIIGGIGRIEGALFGGLLLALIEKLVLRYAPIPSGFAIGVPLVLLIVFLLVRPNGLLPPKGTR